MTTHEYETHLSSVAWQETRGRVLARAKGRCQRCRQARATQVHHVTYRRLGNEDLDDLLALCGLCHKAVTIARTGQLSIPGLRVESRNYLYLDERGSRRRR